MNARAESGRIFRCCTPHANLKPIKGGLRFCLSLARLTTSLLFECSLNQKVKFSGCNIIFDYVLGFPSSSRNCKIILLLVIAR